MLLQTFNAVGIGHTDARNLSINIETLRPGGYELVVTVRDEMAAAQAITKTTFTKLGSGASDTARN
jgi:hypothetical protein